jgi:tripartite-type tricarboxylate transporter receptor subunit TctC
MDGSSAGRRRLGIAMLLLGASRHARPAAPGRLLLPFLPSGPAEIVGTVASSRMQRALQTASGSALSDVLAQMVARILSTHLGEPWPIERMVGAGGERAARRMLAESAGARTLLLVSEALCVHAVLERPGLGELIDRLQPVATCVAVPYVVLRSHADAGCAVGSAGHAGRSAALSRALAARQPGRTGAQPCREVAFNGGAAALQALLGGQVDRAVLPRALAGPWIDDGSLQAQPVPAAALDLPGEGWFAVLAGPGMPSAAVAALGAALQAGVAEPARQAWLGRLGLRAQPEPGPRLARRIQEERGQMAAERRRGHA